MKDKLTKVIVPKGWGQEEWIVNNEKYCGKVLLFEQAKKCSFHYHKLKTETFYLESGILEVKYSWENLLEAADSVTLLPGDSFHVPVGLRHQMYAVEKSKLFEFSTQHFEEDSYRILKGD